MYAVVESGGKQYRVEKGTVLVVDRLKAEQGDKVALKPVMFKDKEVVVDAKGLEKVKIEATVTEHLRGDKIKVFKYKPKKGYSRRAGHRAELTRLEVTSLGGGAKKAAPKKAAEDKAEEKPKAEAKAETAEKKAPAKKPAAKKPAAKAETKTETKAAEKKPAARKPAAKKPAAKKEDTDGA
ncbi:MAG: 50S ribosomal protein L21 [Thermoleophilales bacterium]|nr:50S ribosomal protein L21 [Thermoleophilales bacterium]